MPIGPGKYDDLCTYVREEAKAEAAIVIVFGGAKGSGFSVQTLNVDVLRVVADRLRVVAGEIERSLGKETNR